MDTNDAGEGAAEGQRNRDGGTVCFELDLWPGTATVTVLPGKSIDVVARNVAHRVWDGGWDLYVWDDEMPGAKEWFAGLAPEVRRGLARLHNTDTAESAALLSALGGDPAWLRGVEVFARADQVIEDFRFTLRPGDLAAGATTTAVGTITSITARTVTLWFSGRAVMEVRPGTRRRFDVRAFACQNCRLDHALLQAGER